MRRQTLPSSSPMTPAPMMQTRPGTASQSSAPAESTTMSPVSGVAFSSIGTEPVAMMTFFAAWVLSPPSRSVTLTCLSARSSPVPFNQSILFDLNSISMPPVSSLTMPSFRLIIFGTSRDTLPTLMPMSANWWFAVS